MTEVKSSSFKTTINVETNSIKLNDNICLVQRKLWFQEHSEKNLIFYDLFWEKDLISIEKEEVFPKSNLKTFYIFKKGFKACLLSHGDDFFQNYFQEYALDFESVFKDLLLGELSIDDIEVCEYIQDKDFPTLNKIRDGKPYPKKIDFVFANSVKDSILTSKYDVKKLNSLPNFFKYGEHDGVITGKWIPTEKEWEKFLEERFSHPTESDKEIILKHVMELELCKEEKIVSKSELEQLADKMAQFIDKFDIDESVCKNVSCLQKDEFESDKTLCTKCITNFFYNQVKEERSDKKIP